jgi:6-phosphogluconolactonase
MPYALYVCLQDEDKIVALTMEATTGQLTPQAAVPVAGGPSVLALSPDRHVLYVGHRTVPAISSFRIDPATGGLTPQGTVASPHAPTFLAPDRTGRFLLSAYYQGGYAAVHPLGADGAVGASPCTTLATAMGAHAIQTDPSNQFAFVPHIARFNDNVLEPLRESTGPNAIWQARFDAQTGHLTPTRHCRLSLRRAWAPATTAFIPPSRSSIFPTSRGAVLRPIVWTRRRGPSPLSKRSPPCQKGSPPGTPAPRFT